MNKFNYSRFMAIHILKYKELEEIFNSEFIYIIKKIIFLNAANGECKINDLLSKWDYRNTSTIFNSDKLAAKTRAFDSYKERRQKEIEFIRSLIDDGLTVNDKETHSIDLSNKLYHKFDEFWKSKHYRMQIGRGKLINMYEKAKYRLTPENYFAWSNFINAEVEKQLVSNLEIMLLQLYGKNNTEEYFNKANIFVGNLLYNLSYTGMALAADADKLYYMDDDILKTTPFMIETYKKLILSPELLREELLSKIGEIEDKHTKHVYTEMQRSDIDLTLMQSTNHVWIASKIQYKRAMRAKQAA